MSQRAFFLHLVGWSAVVALAATPVGALVGIMLGFVLVIFATILTKAGALALFGILGTLFLVGATIFGIMGWLSAARRDWHGALACWSTTVALTGLPTAIWLATHVARPAWFA